MKENFKVNRLDFIVAKEIKIKKKVFFTSFTSSRGWINLQSLWPYAPYFQQGPRTLPSK